MIRTKLGDADEEEEEWGNCELFGINVELARMTGVELGRRL